MSEMTKGRDDGQRPAMRRGLSESGICKGTRVLTLDGELPVEFLSAGDPIITRNGVFELRHVATRKTKVFRPVLVARNALGHKRPDRELVLAPDQPVHLRDWRARAFFGSDQAYAPVSHLIDGHYIRQSQAKVRLRVFDLEFEDQQVFYAEGVELVSALPPALVRRSLAAR